MEGLKEYFSNEIIPLNESFDKSNIKLGLLSNLKLLELKSLLYTKMIYAISNHLDIYLDIAEPIDAISMKVVDLTRVIGIFVDNAIEAALETNEKKVEIGIIKKDDSILIIVKNSCIYEKVHMNKIYDSGFSTKGDNRGIGLYSAKQVLNHYENIIHSTCIKDIHFTQQIEILNS
jgi:two-component system sensor histidine kinase AgrC